jgi:hypothetical protein
MHLTVGFKVNSTCGTFKQSGKRDKNHNFLFKSLGIKQINELVVGMAGNKLTKN